MLDDIAFGAFAENPAGKDAIPFLIALIFHHQLHKGTGFRRIFPRGRCLASAQTHNHGTKAALFAGLHRNVLNQAIALVEQAQLGHALVHRRYAVNRLNG
jgi:hypothetical protein